MSLYSVYRLAIWLPIIVPAVLIIIFNTLGLRLSAGVIPELFLYSLIYGGLPYAVIAVWATWWLGGRREEEIRRLMFRAPLLMVAVFVPLARVMGLVVGHPGPFAAVAMLGAAIILPLGYFYVGIAVLLRRILGPQTDRV